MCDKLGQQAPAQVLPALQRNGPARKGSITADLIFCYFWIKPNGVALLSTLKNKQLTKNVKGLPAAIERADAYSQVYCSAYVEMPAGNNVVEN